MFVAAPARVQRSFDEAHERELEKARAPALDTLPLFTLASRSISTSLRRQRHRLFTIGRGFLAKIDVRQRFAALVRGGDRLANHREETFPILGIPNALGSELFGSAQAEKGRS